MVPQKIVDYSKIIVFSWLHTIKGAGISKYHVSNEVQWQG
jgi:hypothetical protein